jgi:hypothetical protein
MNKIKFASEAISGFANSGIALLWDVKRQMAPLFALLAALGAATPADAGEDCYAPPCTSARPADAPPANPNPNNNIIPSEFRGHWKLFRADHLNKPDDNTGGVIVTANKIVFEDDAGVDCKITNIGGLPIVDIFEDTIALSCRYYLRWTRTNR